MLRCLNPMTLSPSLVHAVAGELEIRSLDFASRFANEESSFVSVVSELMFMALQQGLIRAGMLSTHLQAIRMLYRHRRNGMLETLARHCGSPLARNVPQGGMLLWARIQWRVSAIQLFGASLAEASRAWGAFVLWRLFFLGVAILSTLRLSFVTIPPARIKEGDVHSLLVLRRLELSP